MATDDEAYRELKRELDERERVYPQMIGRGLLTRRDAHDRTERLRHALELLEDAMAPKPFCPVCGG